MQDSIIVIPSPNQKRIREHRAIWKFYINETVVPLLRTVLKTAANY